MSYHWQLRPDNYVKAKPAWWQVALSILLAAVCCWALLAP